MIIANVVAAIQQEQVMLAVVPIVLGLYMRNFFLIYFYFENFKNKYFLNFIKQIKKNSPYFSWCCFHHFHIVLYLQLLLSQTRTNKYEKLICFKFLIEE